MVARTIRQNSPESAFSDFTYQFNNTIEGNLIGHLRRYGQATLYELIECVASNKNLRTKHSKRYRNKNIEKLTLSKLVAKQHIFIENQNGLWALDEKAATEYEQKKILEIKEIKEKKHEIRAKLNKKDKTKQEKFKIFNELIDMDIFLKLEQLEEILESSNESAQKQIFEFFEPLSITNTISNS
ncbi:unnamed protein product [Blepharisma stoltei]|uniref:Uncharacterized protein n=1 Tax=Blepharisma stoltei TaxID=1481888 RepID=A0AAU9IEG1_9CILI|nr:unnamed protein product [Blepharisma stoltei]